MTRPAWTIRPVGERDIEAVVVLLAEIAREGSYIATEWPFDLTERARSLRDALLLRRTVGWIATSGRELIGELSVIDITQAEPEIGMIVAAPHRGRGIGRALLENAVTWARTNGKPALTLRVFPDNARALALYRRGGFVETSRQPAGIIRRDGTGRDVLVMRRAIDERTS